MMIGEKTAKMSDGDTAENLLNFINNASSNVQSALSKPGCFKRNTNHRRFLQKQLKANTQRIEADDKKDLSKKPFALSKTKQKNLTRKRSIGFSKESSVTSTTSKSAAYNHSLSKLYNKMGNVLREQCYNRVSHNEHTSFQKELQYLDECKKYTAIIDDIVDNLLEPSGKIEHSAVMASNTTSQSSISYCRAGSVSSTSSTSEDDYTFDFMSGEELVRSLDISELFIPDGHRSPVAQHIEPDTIDVQKMPVFENVFQQFSL